jgi:hypothetical protein
VEALEVMRVLVVLQYLDKAMGVEIELQLHHMVELVAVELELLAVMEAVERELPVGLVWRLLSQALRYTTPAVVAAVGMEPPEVRVVTVVVVLAHKEMALQEQQILAGVAVELEILVDLEVLAAQA